MACLSDSLQDFLVTTCDTQPNYKFEKLSPKLTDAKLYGPEKQKVGRED